MNINNIILSWLRTGLKERCKYDKIETKQILFFKMREIFKAVTHGEISRSFFSLTGAGVIRIIFVDADRFWKQP